MLRLTDYRVLTLDCYGTLIGLGDRDLGRVTTVDHAQREIGCDPRDRAPRLRAV